jgi:uncharacterized Zn-finger protein
VHLKKVHQVAFNPKIHDYNEERCIEISKKHKGNLNFYLQVYFICSAFFFLLSDILNSDVIIKNRSQTYVVQKGAFPCEQCPQSYSTYPGLQRHQKEKHMDDQPEFECNECDRKFVCKTQLWTHSFDHKNGIRPYSCALATCKFTTKYKLS